MTEVTSPVVDTWSRTFSNTVKFSHKWTIDNVSFYCKKSPGVLIESSTFSPKASDPLKFSLGVYPGGQETHDKDYFSVNLCSQMSNISKVMVKYKIYIPPFNDTEEISMNDSRVISPGERWGCSKFLKKCLLVDEVNALLPDDRLTICCDIEILRDVVTVSGNYEPIQGNVLEPRLNDDVGRLFETHKFSDVTLAVGGKDISAHKMILAARSPVFLELLFGSLSKHRPEMDRVEIVGIDHEVFMEMLRFIYTDKAPNLENMAEKLLAVADKYGLERLKTMCAKALYKSLSVDNALNILVISYLHDALELRTLVTNFICDSTEDMIQIAAFESIARAYPSLMVEILRLRNMRAGHGVKYPMAEKIRPQLSQ